MFNDAHAGGVGRQEEAGGGGQDAMLCVMCSFNKYLSAYHMPGTVPTNVDKTVQRNSLSSRAHAPVECGCHSGGDADSVVHRQTQPFLCSGAMHAL